MDLSTAPVPNEPKHPNRFLPSQGVLPRASLADELVEPLIPVRTKVACTPFRTHRPLGLDQEMQGVPSRVMQQPSERRKSL